MNRFSTRLPSSLVPVACGWFALCATSASSRAQLQVDWVAPTNGVSVGVDAADNVYTAYSSSALGSEISVTKRDVHGNLLWEASIDQTTPTAWERASWLGVDGNGDVVVCGTLMSGSSNPVEAASILLKFSASGTPLWRVVYESPFDGSSTRRCLVDGQGDIYVLGLGSGPAGFVTKIKKYSAAGTPVWTWFDPAGIGAPLNFKFAGDGALLVATRGITGNFNGYAKVDRDGNRLWSLAAVPSLTVGDAAGDSLGNTYVVHGENGATAVRKLDPQGALLWHRVYPGAGFRVEVGNDDRPVVSGFPSTGTGGAAFFKLDRDGNLVWANLDADGPENLLLHAQMALDGANNAYLAASTLFAMAVCKVNADGTTGWTATTPGGHADSLAIGHAPGSVYVVGGQTARLLDPSVVPDVRNYCQGAPNSAGPGAAMSHAGSLSIGSNNFHLRVTGSVPGSAGLLYYGGAEVQIPFGDGFRCIGSGSVGTFRLNPPIQSDATGSVTRRVDFTAAPANGGPGAITPGSTLKFQWRYRDLQAGMSGFNFSDGLSVAFHP